MESNAGDFFFAVLISLLILHGGAGAELSMEEDDAELEQQLRRLNKPAIKTIRTEHGDTYDCVDFYKQPAFDHPLLKNHSFHFRMKPGSYRRRTRNEEKPDDGKTVSLEVKSLNCPFGTVPIRRVTKDDLIRAKSLNNQPFTAERHGLHIAVARTKFVPGKKYNGGGANISIEMPRTKTPQYSSGRMEIRNGPDVIQVGWMANPSLYRDNRTRGFISLKTITSSCFNTLCPGFILVTEQYPIDSILPVSIAGGTAYLYDVFIYRDKFSGNWWLELGATHAQVGFWPQRIFTGLKDLAYYIDWGGEVYSPPDVPGPPMGRGDYLYTQKRGHDAYIKEITTINEAQEVEEAQGTEEFEEKQFYYEARDAGHLKGYGHVMFYGGPGGATGYFSGSDVVP